MGDLLIGWPLERKKSQRGFLNTRRSNRYSNLVEAERYFHDGHLITFAPTGAGKGVRVIIPNLLHFEGSVIVIDPKGENFAVTARYRKEILGQKILVLDPFEFVNEETLENIGVTRGSLNPLDLIAFGSNIETQLTMIASLFSGNQDGNTANSEEGDFWNQEAKKLLVGVLGLTIERAKAERQSPLFQSFIDHLYSDDVVYSLAVELDKKGVSEFTNKAIAAFLQKADRERSGVLSTAQSYLNPFISDSLNNHLNSSSISPQEISQSDKYTTEVS